MVTVNPYRINQQASVGPAIPAPEIKTRMVRNYGT
jgi:hypothetical protein